MTAPRPYSGFESPYAGFDSPFPVGAENWWDALQSSSGVDAIWAAQFAAIEGGQYMAGGASKTFAQALALTRASTGTYSTLAALLATAAIDVARFDHVPATGVRLGLLGEMERIYFALRSNEFDVAPWASARNDLTGAKTTGPDGVSDSGWKFLDDNDGTENTVVINQQFSVDNSTAYTFPFFAKKDQLNWAALSTSSFTTPADDSSYFDLDNGVVGTAAAGHTIDMEDIGNGWYRCWITFTTDAVDVVGKAVIRLADADLDDVVDRDGTSSIFIFGAGFVLGAYPGSYVEVEASPVTRKADIISLVADGGLPHTGYDAAKDTYAIGFTLTDVTTEQVLLSLNDGTTDNRVELYVVSGNLKVRMVTATAAQADITLGTVTSRTAHTAAFSFIEDAVRGSLDGAAEVNDLVSNTIPAVSQCDIFSQLGTTSIVGQGWLNYLYQYPSDHSGADLLALAS